MGNWKAIGPILFPTDVSGQINGIGRVSQIKFHPSNSQKMYAVSASGGLWISNDGAETWQRTGTDDLPGTSCASVCVDYNNDQILYLGTGDANYYGGGWGIWKSTDGGAHWSVSNNGIGNRLAVEILMHPSNNNELIAATNNGIWKSYDAGASWTVKKSGGDFKDMVFKPVPGSSTIYAVTSNQFFRSTNMGETWTLVSIPGAGIAEGGRLAVSKAAPEIVYLSFVGNHGNGTATPVLRSTNSGQSFTIMKAAGAPNLNGYQPDESGQGSYNYGMTADPNNANIVYIVGHVVWKSTDGGVSWNKLTNWWATVHTDMHDIKISPYDGTKLFNANDGGVWLSTDGGNNWAPKSDGLEATECYSAGQSPIRKGINYIGTQDNGELYFNNNAWFTNRGGDWGSRMVLDYQQATVSYYLADGTRRSLNQGAQAWSPVPSNDESELEFTPLQNNLAFFSSNDIWRTTNLTTAPPSWTKITNINKPLKALASSPANPNLLYAATQDGQFLRSENALSASPSFITLSAPSSQNTVKVSIAGIKNDPNIVYTTWGSKVYRSDNKGASWVNVSAGLPDVNILKIYHDIYSNDESVYVGMATGVYYKNNTMTQWLNYSNGLPTIAHITDFMIFNDGTSNSVIKVSYYGRGVWQSPLFKWSSDVFCEGTGKIIREQWNNIEGDQVSAIPVETAPSSISEITRFEATPNIADAYGSRIRGYIVSARKQGTKK